MQTLFTQEILLHWQAWLRPIVMILISSLLAIAGHALVWASAYVPSANDMYDLPLPCHCGIGKWHLTNPLPAFRKPAVARPPSQQTPETPSYPILSRLSRRLRMGYGRAEGFTGSKDLEAARRGKLGGILEEHEAGNAIAALKAKLAVKAGNEFATLTSHRGDMAMEASAFAGKPIEPSMPVTDHLRRLLEKAQTIVSDALAAGPAIAGATA